MTTETPTNRQRVRAPRSERMRQRAQEQPPVDTKAIREELLATILNERHCVEAWRRTDCSTPPGISFWQAAHDLVVAWGFAEQIPDELLALSRPVLEYARQLRNHILRWEGDFESKIPMTPDECDGVLKWSDEIAVQLRNLDRPRPKLESVSELLAQGVSTEQISRMWGCSEDDVKAEKRSPGSVTFTPPTETTRVQVDRSAFEQIVRDIRTTAQVVEILFDNPEARDEAERLDPENRIFRRGI